MCRPVTCKFCGKTTWAGCGKHVEQVLAGIPRAGQCLGHPVAKQQGRGTNWLIKLFGR